MWSWLYPMYKLLGILSSCSLIKWSQSVYKSTLLYNNLESGNTCIIKCTGNTHSEEYHMISNVDHCEVIFTYHQSNWQFHILDKYFNIIMLIIRGYFKLCVWLLSAWKLSLKKSCRKLFI